MTFELHLAQDEATDRLLTENPFALLMGMLLDQQFPMERAFAGPALLTDRFGALEPARIAAADPDQFATMCATAPAIHRYPASMATRIQALAAHIEEHYDGVTTRIWDDATSGADLLNRLRALPGFGAQKAQIFTALVGKQLGVRPDGWQLAAGDYAEPGSYRSVADVVGPDSLDKVRTYKQEVKAAKRAQG